MFDQCFMSNPQNLSLEKPKKKSGRIWGHSHALGMVSQMFKMLSK